ncbi:MAG: metalloregulator ArsR/SmtB family transcription factor [Hyphomonadaceae bacterium]
MPTPATRTAPRAKPRKTAAAPARPRKRAASALSAVDDLEPRAVEAARLLKMLANEQRLTVLCRLSGGEMSVTELGQYVNLSQSALSQHLAKLRADGLVSTRRDAQTIYYRLADPIAERLIGVLCELYGGPAHD